MKKLILGVALIGIMILTLSSYVFAATVYVDGMVANGAYDNGNGKSDTSEQYIIGTNIPIGSYKIGLEYANIKDKKVPGIGDIRTDAYNLKGGYCLIREDAYQVYGNLGYFNEKKDKNDIKFQAALLSLDGTYNLNDKISLDGELGASLCGKYKADPDTDIDADLFLCKVKLNYSFAENIGASFGYRYDGLKKKFSSGDSWEKHKAFTLGLTYKF